MISERKLENAVKQVERARNRTRKVLRWMRCLSKKTVSSSPEHQVAMTHLEGGLVSLNEALRYVKHMHSLNEASKLSEPAALKKRIAEALDELRCNEYAGPFCMAVPGWRYLYMGQDGDSIDIVLARCLNMDDKPMSKGAKLLCNFRRGAGKKIVDGMLDCVVDTILAETEDGAD